MAIILPLTEVAFTNGDGSILRTLDIFSAGVRHVAFLIWREREGGREGRGEREERERGERRGWNRPADKLL